jgi:hypothetical protein
MGPRLSFYPLLLLTYKWLQFPIPENKEIPHKTLFKMSCEVHQKIGQQQGPYDMSVRTGIFSGHLLLTAVYMDMQRKLTRAYSAWPDTCLAPTDHWTTAQTQPGWLRP